MVGAILEIFIVVLSHLPASTVQAGVEANLTPNWRYT